MAQDRPTVVQTVTIIGTQALIRPDGRAAIRLKTKEMGSIAFEVDQRAIDWLRNVIATAETHLRQPKQKQ
jgi:hypothetical protein